jgi:hypothetical protein
MPNPPRAIPLTDVDVAAAFADLRRHLDIWAQPGARFLLDDVEIDILRILGGELTVDTHGCCRFSSCDPDRHDPGDRPAWGSWEDLLSYIQED